MTQSNLIQEQGPRASARQGGAGTTLKRRMNPHAGRWFAARVDPESGIGGLAFLRDALAMFLIVASVVLLTACGGGGSGAGAGSGSGTGTVALLFTDMPTEEFDRIVVDVREIGLLSDEHGQITIFESSMPGDGLIDLLDLQTHAELFALAADVPAGTYNKIRLFIDSITLITLDDATPPEIASTQDVKLPANGKLDLNPREGIELAPGQTLMIELDMDANKSLHLHQTGRGDWRLRPVIFVDVEPQGLVRINGTVNAIDPDLVVCQGVAPDALCVTVDTANASLFGPDGLPLAVPIAVDDVITAIGFLLAGETEGDLVLDARVVQVGDTFERFAGTVATAPSAGMFNFTVGDGQSLPPGAPLTVLLQAGTRVFNRAGAELGVVDIVIDSPADIDGVRDTAPEPDTLLATLIVLDTAPAEAMLAGTVSAAGDGQVTVVSETGDRCVNARSSGVYTVAAGSSTEGDTSDLAVGKRIDAYGEQGVDGCFTAGTVIVTAD